MIYDFNQRIVAWNLKRNGLHFDANLEIRMLSEEAHEFFTAETLVDKVDAYCDFMFVSVGTLAKSRANSISNFFLMEDYENEVERLENYIKQTSESIRVFLFDALTVKLGTYNEEIFNRLINEAMDVVINANEAKGTERDEHGKVKKGKDYKKPEPLIEGIINSYVRNAQVVQFNKRGH